MGTTGSQTVEARRESPIDVALNNLGNLIGRTQEIMNRFETVLSSVLTSPEKSPETKKDTQEPAPAQTSLESQLLSMGNDISGINEYLREVQDRVQR